MEQKINDLLFDELNEAHGYFEIIMDYVKEKESDHFCNNLITIENNSYRLSYNAIDKMNEVLKKYEELHRRNEDFFEEDSSIIIKFTLLYIVSIIVIKIFSKTLSSDKLNEIWYAMIGVLLGSVNMGMLYSNLNNHRYSCKKSREIMDEEMTLKEEYNKNFEIARREIGYMFSLNKNLDTSIIDQKKLSKTIKGMHE